MAGPNYQRNYSQRKLTEIIPQTHQCKWIEGEKPYGPKPYCDKPTVIGSSYCPQHDFLCHRPIDPETNERFIRFMLRVAKY